MSLQTDAIQNGKLRYSTGKACRRGHMSERYSKSGLCVECVKLHDSERTASKKAANILRNTTLFEPGRVHSVIVPQQYRYIVDALAVILNSNNTFNIATCERAINSLCSTGKLTTADLRVILQYVDGKSGNWQTFETRETEEAFHINIRGRWYHIEHVGDCMNGLISFVHPLT